MSDRNKIAQSLTVEQLDEFISTLAAKPGRERTLEAIKAAASERGITISLMSAKAFRDTTFDRHLERIRLANDVATQIEAIESGGNTLADASAKLIAKQTFAQLLAAEDEDAPPEGADLEKLSLIIQRVRAGDAAKRALEARLRESDAKLRDFERQETEREETKRALREQLTKADRKGGLSKDTLEQIEQSLALL